jgi:hypothetical protein
MPDSDEYRCPDCDSTDLTSIQLTGIDDELLECQSNGPVSSTKLLSCFPFVDPNGRKDHGSILDGIIFL